ncbi:MAG: hypothetical protein HY361_03510 [Candidatus Aenigmarchaeota archaeon]|nr:hypothetical protein [Candidatus Aenigmarchaeota archaeon]
MGLKEHIHFKDVAKIYILTWQFILIRFLLMLVFIGIAIVYFSSVFGIVLSQIGVENLISTLLSIGSISTATYLYWHIYKLFSKYVLYLFKGAHIAVVTNYIQTGKVSQKSQLIYGFKTMKDKFLSVSVLFVVHALLETVLKEAHTRLMKLGDWAKLPKALTYVISGTINTAIAFIDEAILAYMFTRKNEDALKSAKDGLVLYVKNWLWILLTAAILSIIVYGTMAAAGIFIYFEGIPFSSLDLILQSMYSVLTVGIVIILYSGLVQPLLEIAIIVTYLKEIKGQSPDIGTVEWLKENSKGFRDLASTKVMEKLIGGAKSLS